MTDERYDSSSESQIAKKKTKQRLETEAELKRLQFIMNDERGRAFMYSLLEQAHVFQTSFNPDPIVMAFREGERNVGLKLISVIQSRLTEKYMLMLKESEEKHERDSR